MACHRRPKVRALIEIPPYIRLIVDNQPKRSNSAQAPGRATDSSGEPEKSGLFSGAPGSHTVGDVVYLVSIENKRATRSEIPTKAEAQQALERLQKDLPQLGQAVDDLHSKLDRRRILSLLAPLVEG